MSLITRLSDFITAVGTDIKGLLATRGTMASLSTTEKSNLVGALNELKDAIDAVAAGSGAISDGTTGSSTTWSSTKISAQIASAISDLVNGAPSAFDTLKELSDELANQESAASALTTAVGNRVRYDAAQTLDSTQKAQANTNMGSASLANTGDLDTDLAALYTAAKA